MPMMHSRMTDEWLAAVVRGNPIRIAEKTGNIITCPVRLQYINLLAPAKAQDGDAPDKKPGYNVVACLPPGAEAGIQNILHAAIYAEERKSFPNNFGPDGRSFGLHSPLRDQREKARTRAGAEVEGFTPGLFCFTANTQMKPQITDTAGNPIVDPARIYPGVWALLAINTYAYGIKPQRPKIGVGIGLQNVMIFADDNRCGGGGSDPKDDFAGVQIDQAYNPSAAFGNAPSPQQGAYMPPSNVMPPAQPIYAPPATPQQAYNPSAQQGIYAPPATPQQGWAPPVQPESFW
jgi:hypothetical protein